IMIEFVVDRFDIVPAVLALAAVYCYVTKRYTLAFALLAMGTMIKIYPAVLFPVFMVPLIMDRNWNEILKGTGVFAVVSLAVIVPVLILQPEMLSEMISYHADRPLQIETIASSFIYPFAMLGLTDVWISDSTEFGSDNLRGTLPDAAASILTFVMIALVIVVCIIYAMILKKLKGMGSKDDRRYLFASTILIVVMMFVMIGKVFSSQYLLWIIPPLTVLLMISSDEKWNRIVFILFAVILAVTQLQFAYNVGYLGGGENINDIGMMMILLRNILMIALLYYVVKPICDRYLFTKRPAEPC
ncbi:MAG: DUF2029 domain-containing protein, partial [Methanomassiliicoccaceae archaeon]|nr:DUF2029 domain-containing protein [Methanomassiliicoccaceae archaeon]